MLRFVRLVFGGGVWAGQRLALVLVLDLVMGLVLHWFDLFSSKVQIWYGLHKLCLGFLQKSVNVLSAVLG